MPISTGEVLEFLRRAAEVLHQNKEYLTELDSAIGDADHGVNMDRGFQAVCSKLPAAVGQDTGSILKMVAMTLISTVGGASGALYGTFFLKMAGVTAGKLELSPADWCSALAAGVEGIARRGKAVPGDKTMLDTLIPGLEALKSAVAADAPFAEALHQSAQAAQQGMLSTIPLVARKGRASYLGERSAGHQDPGATSACLLLQAAADTFSK